MERISGPHRFPGGFYHLVAHQGKYYGLDLRLPDFAARLTFLKEGGFTMIALTPCCAQGLDRYPLPPESKQSSECPPYRCSYCGAISALPGIIDTWWQCGSVGSMVERIEYYLEAWSRENTLANEIRAHQVTDLVNLFEPELAILRGCASAWPKRGPSE